MIESCANPACCVPFLRFREGRVFITDHSNKAPEEGRSDSSRLEFSWLCG